jgi:hypothetical protein
MIKTRIFIIIFFIIAAILYTVGFSAVSILKLDKTIPITIPTNPNIAGTPTNIANLSIDVKSKFYIDKVVIEITNNATGEKTKKEEKYTKLGNDKIFVAMLYTCVFSIIAIAIGILLLLLNIKVLAKIALVIGILCMVSISILLIILITNNSVVNVIKDVLKVAGLGVNDKLEIDSGFILIVTGTLLALLDYFVLTFA